MENLQAYLPWLLGGLGVASQFILRASSWRWREPAYWVLLIGGCAGIYFLTVEHIPHTGDARLDALSMLKVIVGYIKDMLARTSLTAAGARVAVHFGADPNSKAVPVTKSP